MIMEIRCGETYLEKTLPRQFICPKINDFEVFSEQYYLHYDPNVEIVATTTFNGKDFPWINGVKMPVAWKKLYGNGKVFFISIGHNPGEFKRYKNGWELLKRGLIWAGS